MQLVPNTEFLDYYENAKSDVRSFGNIKIHLEGNGHLAYFTGYRDGKIAWREGNPEFLSHIHGVSQEELEFVDSQLREIRKDPKFKLCQQRRLIVSIIRLNDGYVAEIGLKKTAVRAPLHYGEILTIRDPEIAPEFIEQIEKFIGPIRKSFRKQLKAAREFKRLRGEIASMFAG